MKDLSLQSGVDLEMTAKRITLESELAIWTDQQTASLGMTLSTFVSVLLEWARDEDIANDDMLFKRAHGHRSDASFDSGVKLRTLSSRKDTCSIAAQCKGD